jgi:hypothetical protein
MTSAALQDSPAGGVVVLLVELECGMGGSGDTGVAACQRTVSNRAMPLDITSSCNAPFIIMCVKKKKSKDTHYSSDKFSTLFKIFFRSGMQKQGYQFKRDCR